MNDFSAALSDYRRAFPDGSVKLDEPMSSHTTLRIGGEVKGFFTPAGTEELCELLRILKCHDVKTIVVGNGSNLLFGDGKLDMAVISTKGLNMVEVRGNSVRAEAGAVLARIANTALDASLTGFEFAAGIPGTLGGALYMNAGAYGSEMKDVVTSVKVLTDDFSERTLTNEECGFAYRHSLFGDKGLIALSADIALTQGDAAEIKDKMDGMAQKRLSSQPLNFPSAGSTFKRPKDGYAAAMIDEAGLKGFSIGGAQVSEKHAGFVVNTGGATFSDFTAVMSHVQDAVYKRFGVMLEPEIKIIR